MRISPLFAAAALFAAPALAQAQSPADEPPPVPGPGSAAASANADAAAVASTQNTVSIRPEDQAAYDADVAAYRVELQAHRRTARADAAYAARQERAYADAMHAWRIQVADCKRGIGAACRAATPRPADFM